MIRKSTVEFAARAAVENVPFVARVVPQDAIVAEKLPEPPFWFRVMLAVPVFVWQDHDVAVRAPIMFTKKLFWLSLVVRTGELVVLSVPAM